MRRDDRQRLLPLFRNGRCLRLRGGLDGFWPSNRFDSRSRRLRALGRRCGLRLALRWRRRLLRLTLCRRRRLLRLTLCRHRRLLRRWLFEVLANVRVARHVAIVLAAKRLLLLRLRIPIGRVASLVGGQRRGRRRGTAVPLIPPASTLLPRITPVLAPARRSVRLPAAEVRRRTAVVAHGYPKDEEGHVLRTHQVPRSVVPGARVPVVALVGPVHTVVEEEIRLQLRRVVDRIARHADELREQRHIDADAHTGKADADAQLGRSRGQQAESHRQHDDQVAHLRILLCEYPGRHPDLEWCSMTALALRDSALAHTASVL